jgi:predicted phosphate transport protein (TIGR00153 family)
MLTIARLFGKSPFAPLQSHMDKVAGCMEKLSSVFQSLPSISSEQIEKFVTELSELEHEADITKNDIRNHLPKSIFLPIDRGHFLEILALQDSIADKTEDIGILLTLRPLALFKNFNDQLQALFKKSSEVFWDAKHIIEEIDELLESSFGGVEAEKVKEMVEHAAYKEHEVDLLQRSLMKQLFSSGETLSSPDFYLWQKLIEEVYFLANLSEKLANRIRMVLELN